MEIKPQETLELAFRQLDTFSVPGVGTFKRKYFPARIDTASKQVFPPSEEFIMEPGDEFVAILENFYFRFYKIKIDEAKDMVARLRTHVVHELKQHGKLQVEGYGELQMSNGKEFSFIANSDGAGVASQFFGLGPVNYTLGESSSKPKGAVVAETKKTPTPAVIVPEQEPPRTLAAASSAQGAKPEAPKEERSRAGLWAFLFLLVAVAATAGIVYRAELGSGIQQLGWFSGEEGSGTAQVDSTDGNAANGDPLANSTDPASDPSEESGDPVELTREFVEEDPVTEEPLEEVEPVIEEPVVEEVVEEVVVEEPVEEESTFDETVGTRPADGQYYLIVKSSKDPMDAQSMARNVDGKILRPRYSGNYYRISVFNSPNKSAVIQKMVSLKSRFGKSWIYWNGM